MKFSKKELEVLRIALETYRDSITENWCEISPEEIDSEIETVKAIDSAASKLFPDWEPYDEDWNELKEYLADFRKNS